MVPSPAVSLSITLKLVRNALSQALPVPAESEPLRRVGPAICVFKNPPGDLVAGAEPEALRVRPQEAEGGPLEGQAR